MESTQISTQASPTWRSRVNDSFVHARCGTLHRLFNISADSVLNIASPDTSQPNTGLIISEISKTINLFKQQAISSGGKHVNYAKLKRSDVYQQYRQQLTPLLRAINLDNLGDQNQTTAFWINLYNALVIDGVIHANISTSVTDGFLGILRFFYRSAYNVGGMRFSLDDIEHGILRANQGSVFLPGPQFSADDPRLKYALPELDARLHFALNCASCSCPPIAIYSAEQLDTQLDLASRNYLDQEVQLDEETGKLYITQLLKWYQMDFGGKLGVFAFLCEHLPDDERRAWLKARKRPGNVNYLPYNWSLNI